jgi:hypothetical protein
MSRAPEASSCVGISNTPLTRRMTSFMQGAAARTRFKTFEISVNSRSSLVAMRTVTADDSGLKWGRPIACRTFASASRIGASSSRARKVGRMLLPSFTNS